MSRRELWLGLAIALALRVGFTVHAYHKEAQPTPTGVYEYEPIARGLLASGVYSDPPGGVPTARREPGYILFVALVYSILGEHRMWVFLVQCLLSALTAGVLRSLTARLYGERAGRFAFWACVFYPYFIYYAGYFFREDFLAFLLACLLWLLVFRTQVWAAAAAGALAGWLCLANGAWAPACGWLALALLVNEPAPRRLKRAAAFLAPVVLLVALWTARNWRVFGTFIPFSSNVGGEMYITAAVPYDLLGTEEQTRRLNADEPFQAASRLDEIPRHQEMMRLVRARVLAAPGEYLAGMAERFVKLWRLVPRARAYTHAYAVVFVSALLSDGWLVPLALFGFWLKRRDPWARWFLMPAVVLVTLAFSTSQAPIRYRVPLMIPMLMLAAAGFDELARRLRAPRPN